MKVLWVNANYLHPTTKGGQIRTLEMLKHIHRRHEVHYATFEDPSNEEGPRRAREYSAKVHAWRHNAPSRNSPAFYGQVLKGAVSPLPVAISRWYSRAMEQGLARLAAQERFDVAICDFLAPAVQFPNIEKALLFQHNVETMIWRRHAEHAGDPIRRLYMSLQARRMFNFEGSVCRRAGHIVSVSKSDTDTMRELFGVTRISDVPTGVDVDYFNPAGKSGEPVDLVFVGSMDWLPNIDGMTWFLDEILPLIRRRRPSCSVAIVGRKPPQSLLDRAAADKLLRVTGTIPDIRPWLWGARVSIVPLRIGGGTRLKIYEAMAAGAPVVSTAVGAEGLDVQQGENILLADDPAAFAECCLGLLADEGRRGGLASVARTHVVRHYSWDGVARSFEAILESGPCFH
jgi:polysaccharide biosynthesis protein PslH